jgi:hypothetical protein
MPDTYTYFIFGYGILMSGMIIYVISLAVRQYLLEQKKKSLQDEAHFEESLSKKSTTK